MSVLSLVWCLATAQAAPAQRTYRVAALNEGVAIPFTSVTTIPMNPGVLGGVSLFERAGGSAEHRVQLDAGFYHHKVVEDVVFVVPTWQTTWKPASWVGLSVIGGVGYKHVFYPGETFVKEGDAYVARRQLGRPEVTAVAGVGVSVPLSPSISVLAQYRGTVDGPFSSTLGVPAMTHIQGLIGLEYKR